MISGVNEDGVGRGSGVEPLSAMLYLKAGDSVVYEKGEEAVVGVRWEADCLIGLRARRIQIRGVELKTGLQLQSLIDVALFKSQVLGDSMEQRSRHCTCSFRELTNSVPNV